MEGVHDVNNRAGVAVGLKKVQDLLADGDYTRTVAAITPDQSAMECVQRNQSRGREDRPRDHEKEGDRSTAE